MPLTNTSKADLLLLLATLLAAISWMFSREAIQQMPSLLFIASRFLMAGMLLALIGRKQLLKITARQYRRAMGVGMVFGLAMCCWITGLNHATHVGEGAFLTSLAVVLVPVIARILFAEQQPVSTWLALPVAASGLALLSLQDGFRPEPGQLFFVLAAFIFALYYTLNTRAANELSRYPAGEEPILEQRIPALALTTIALLTVGIVATTLSFLLEPWQPTFHNLQGSLIGWVIASALIGTAARFLVQTYAQSLSPNSHGVVILVVEPIWVALIAAAWFDETMSTLQFSGCATIFAALLINRWRLIGRAIRRR